MAPLSGWSLTLANQSVHSVTSLPCGQESLSPLSVGSPSFRAFRLLHRPRFLPHRETEAANKQETCCSTCRNSPAATAAIPPPHPGPVHSMPASCTAPAAFSLTHALSQPSLHPGHSKRATSAASPGLTSPPGRPDGSLTKLCNPQAGRQRQDHRAPHQH